MNLNKNKKIKFKKVNIIQASSNTQYSIFNIQFSIEAVNRAGRILIGY
jgi:hypothetical protein